VNGRRFVVAVIAVIGVVALAGSAGCGNDRSEQGYSDDTRASFLEPCIAGLGEEGRDVCECSYDLIAEGIPFADFEDVDRALQGDPDAELPDEVADIVAACAADPDAARDQAAEEEETTTTPLP
jgi:hypothetical protein